MGCRRWTGIPGPSPPSLPHTSHPFLHFPTSRLVIPPHNPSLIFWARHFTFRVSCSLISCRRLFLWDTACLSVVMTVVVVLPGLWRSCCQLCFFFLLPFHNTWVNFICGHFFVCVCICVFLFPIMMMSIVVCCIINCAIWFFFFLYCAKLNSCFASSHNTHLICCIVV